MTRIAGNYPSRSSNGKIELRILNQPEEQHRARYLTEGSRGSIKDGTGLGHPVVKLFGFNGCAVKLQCFIGHDKHIGVPHLFYQASRITGKNSTRCSYTKVDGTSVITLDLVPENNMQTTIDCIGILKERNVDVEQKVLRLKSSNGIYNNGDTVAFPSKKRCAKCRLVFRCKIPGTNEILQAVSTPILCTQPVGTPEICKISLTECKVIGGKELYVIGKNFLKDSKVIFKSDNWGKVIEPDKEYLHSSHLICTIPPYDGPNAALPGYFSVSISVRSGGKYSDSHVFTYVNDSPVNSLPFNHSNDNLSNQQPPPPPQQQQPQHHHHHHQHQQGQQPPAPVPAPAPAPVPVPVSGQLAPVGPLVQLNVTPVTDQQQQRHGHSNTSDEVGGQYPGMMMMTTPAAAAVNVVAKQESTPTQPTLGFLSHGNGHHGSILDGIKQESPSPPTPTALLSTPILGQLEKTLLNVPTAISMNGQYYSEDTFLSSDSSAISETILGSEDSSFSFLFPPF